MQLFKKIDKTLKNSQERVDDSQTNKNKAAGISNLAPSPNSDLPKKKKHKFFKPLKNSSMALFDRMMGHNSNMKMDISGDNSNSIFSFKKKKRRVSTLKRHILKVTITSSSTMKNTLYLSFLCYLIRIYCCIHMYRSGSKITRKMALITIYSHPLKHHQFIVI